MSRGWEAVSQVGASLLARGQRKRDLEDELALKAKYDREQWDREASKRELEAKLLEERIASERAKQEASRATADRAGFDIMAGKVVGNQRFFKSPNQDGILAEEVGVSADKLASITAANERARLGRESRERIAKGEGKRTPSKGTDHTARLAALDGKEAAIFGMSDAEISKKNKIPPAEAPFWRTTQINSINAERERLEAAQKAREQPVSLLDSGVTKYPDGGTTEFTGPEDDVDAAIVGSGVFGKEPKTVTAPQVVGGGPKAEENKDPAVAKTYEQAYAEGFAAAKAAKLSDEDAKVVAEEYAVQFKK